MSGSSNAPAGAASSQHPPQPERAPKSALVSWVLFDWATQPFYTLILTFLFAPYFANFVVGDPVAGQSYWGYATAVAGILIAIGSPVLGAMADRQGARKPWIGVFSIGLFLSLCALWLAKPGAGTGAIILVLAAFIVATAMAEFATVFSNAIMPTLVGPHEVGRLSGIGWAAGYAGGLVSLALIAGLLVGDSETGKTIFGYAPLIGGDPASHTGDRLVGPFSAIWFAIFMIPFFLFVPDITRSAQSPESLSRGPFGELWDTLRMLSSFPDMMYFLLARMLYSDGLAAIFAFGGIYGASVFQWRAIEMGLFGIILTVAGVAGALIGGWINDKVGSRAVISVSLIILVGAVIGILSVDKSHVLFVIEAAEKAQGSAPFSSTGEHVFLMFSVLVGLVAAPVQSASRVLLAALAPVEKRTQFFGLFAFSGKVTAFLAPLLVATVTDVTDSQRLGMAAILVFLIGGFFILRRVSRAL